MKVVHLNESGGGIIASPSLLVPEGIYEVRYQWYYTRRFGSEAKLEVVFGICGQDEYDGSTVSRWYNVLEIGGSPRKYGDYRIAPRSACALEFRALVGRSARVDRVSHCALRGMLIEAEVRTVRKSWSGDLVPECLQYSVINKLLRRIDHSGTDGLD